MYSCANKDPHGLAGSFLEKADPYLPFDDALEAMKKEAKLLENRQHTTL